MTKPNQNERKKIQESENFWKEKLADRRERLQLLIPLAQTCHEGLNLRPVLFQEGEEPQDGDTHHEAKRPPGPHLVDCAGRMPHHAHEAEQSEHRTQIQKRPNSEKYSC